MKNTNELAGLLDTVRINGVGILEQATDEQKTDLAALLDIYEAKNVPSAEGNQND